LYLIFKLQITEHEQQNSYREINLKEAKNEIESLRTTIKENEQSFEGFYVSLFKNINYT
jgi:peptidoglycan hydrolase CwlO-like protein